MVRESSARGCCKRAVDIHLLFLGTISRHERRIYPRREDVARGREFENPTTRQPDNPRIRENGARGGWEGRCCKRTLQEDIARGVRTVDIHLLFLGTISRYEKNIPIVRGRCERTVRGSISLLLKGSFQAADCSFSCSCSLLPGLSLFLSIFEKNVLVCVKNVGVDSNIITMTKQYRAWL